MKPVNNERIIVALIKTGEWEIDDNGFIWRNFRRCGGSPGKAVIVPCKRTRAEKPDYNHGYLLARVSISGIRYTCPAHRLVWQSSNGDIPDGLFINHKNGVKSCNRIDNLELVTSSENMIHAYSTGLKHENGEANPAAKLTEANVREIRRLYQSGSFLMVELSRKFGCCKQTITDIINRSHWKHLA